jgi:hypothetical protein
LHRASANEAAPRERECATISIYQPQLQSWNGNVDAYAAVTFKTSGTAETNYASPDRISSRAGPGPASIDRQSPCTPLM